jgi:hypothetical protein
MSSTHLGDRVNEDENPPLREYVGFIWIDRKPTIPLRILATSPDEARARVIEEYGEDCFFSIGNEEDRHRLR